MLKENIKEKGVNEMGTNLEYQKNLKICKDIAEDLEALARGSMHACPLCGEWFDMDHIAADEDQEERRVITCPCCRDEIDFDGAEAADLYEYINRHVLDIEYRIDSKLEYKSVKLLICFGGPNVYIDTADNLVKLYWWNEYADYYIEAETAEAIDAIFEEYYLMDKRE